MQLHVVCCIDTQTELIGGVGAGGFITTFMNPLLDVDLN